MNQALQEQLKLNVKQSLEEFQTPGAAIAVQVDGETFLATGVGYQDIEQQVPLSTNANFYIYSITKSLLAIASLHLVSEGQLNLDASIQPYLPDCSLDTSVTLRQLLSHTSGLPDYGGIPAYFDAVRAAPSSPWSTQAFLDLAQTQGWQFTSGEGWAYSNIGYLLVKCILEKVTGVSMQQCLHEIIFSPLALQKTFVPSTLDDVRELTPGYSSSLSGDELQDVTFCYHPGWVAHGVVISTAPELAKIIDALFTGKLLNPLTVKQMLDPIHILGMSPLLGCLGYGIGLFLGVDTSYGTVGGHVGEGPGYSAAAFHFPNLARSRITLVALANRDRHDWGLQLVARMTRTLEMCAFD